MAETLTFADGQPAPKARGSKQVAAPTKQIVARAKAARAKCEPAPTPAPSGRRAGAEATVRLSAEERRCLQCKGSRLLVEVQGVRLAQIGCNAWLALPFVGAALHGACQAVGYVGCVAIAHECLQTCDQPGYPTCCPTSTIC